jgi:hypothetical protein
MNFIYFICFLATLASIYNGDFGFAPITGAGSLGENIGRLCIYCGAIYPIFIALKSNKKISDIPKGDK